MAIETDLSRTSTFTVASPTALNKEQYDFVCTNEEGGHLEDALKAYKEKFPAKEFETVEFVFEPNDVIQLVVAGDHVKILTTGVYAIANGVIAESVDVYEYEGNTHIDFDWMDYEADLGLKAGDRVRFSTDPEGQDLVRDVKGGKIVLSEGAFIWNTQESFDEILGLYSVMLELDNISISGQGRSITSIFIGNIQGDYIKVQLKGNDILLEKLTVIIDGQNIQGVKNAAIFSQGNGISLNNIEVKVMQLPDLNNGNPVLIIHNSSKRVFISNCFLFYDAISVNSFEDPDIKKMFSDDGTDTHINGLWLEDAYQEFKYDGGVQ
jgi:hypothetical protein